MSIEIIGAGFGRTGTLSLKMALEQLGYAKCYHMHDLFKHPGHAETWTGLAKGEDPDWPTLFNGYRALVDWPCAYFWRELVDYYPQAKVLLTVRDPDAWYDSIVETIFTVIDRAFPDGATEPQLPKGTSDIAAAQIIMAKLIISDHLFGGRFDDRQHCISVYEQHNAEVRRLVPAEKLLVYEVKQGWEPLCQFLDIAEPNTPFPRSNTKDEFLSAINKP
ncbi:MAG: sulfotransferase [Cycloclasticus sp.]|nr:sulfotransferase [Cycloclasticus sp.]